MKRLAVKIMPETTYNNILSWMFDTISTIIAQCIMTSCETTWTWCHTCRQTDRQLRWLVCVQMPPMPSVYSSELVNLIRAMLNKTAEKRPSVSRVLRDPYIKRNIALFLEETRTRFLHPHLVDIGKSVKCLSVLLSANIHRLVTARHL